MLLALVCRFPSRGLALEVHAPSILGHRFCLDGSIHNINYLVGKTTIFGRGFPASLKNFDPLSPGIGVYMWPCLEENATVCFLISLGKG